MKRAHLLVAAAPLLVLCSPVHSSAQALPYKNGSVWEMTFIRIKPGMELDYLNNLRANWRRLLDEEKKQGLVTSYKVIESDAANPDDWNTLLLVEYPSMAIMDSLDEKVNTMATKMFGTPTQQRAQATQRGDMRVIMGTKLGREVVLRDTTVTASRP